MAQVDHMHLCSSLSTTPQQHRTMLQKASAVTYAGHQRAASVPLNHYGHAWRHHQWRQHQSADSRRWTDAHLTHQKLGCAGGGGGGIIRCRLTGGCGGIAQRHERGVTTDIGCGASGGLTTVVDGSSVGCRWPSTTPK